MAEHTPGEWMYSGGYPAFVAAPDEDEPGNALKAMVCDLDARLEEYERPQDEVDANGFLISAAPDLLAYAKAVEQWEADLILDLRVNILESMSDDLYNRFLALQNQRNDAIKKAEKRGHA